LIIAVNAFILAYILPGVNISDFGTAIIVAFVLAILDALIKPLLILLTLPATILTFGLFLFVINALVILLDAWFVMVLASKISGTHSYSVFFCRW
jgi:putative membrane protein